MNMLNKKIVIITVCVATILLIIVALSFAYAKRIGPQKTTFDQQRTPTRTPSQVGADVQKKDDPYIFPPTDEELKQEQNYYKVSYPDVYVVNQLPHESEKIRVEKKELRSDGVYVITVTSKIADSAAAQQEFLQWLQSLGLTAEQISTLTVVYQ